MPARIIDGKAIAQQIRDDLATRIAAVRDGLGRPPHLAIAIVGDDPASHVYVRNKLRTAEDSGMNVTLETLPGSASLDETLAVVERFNTSAQIDGILVAVALARRDGPQRRAAGLRHHRPRQGR